MLADWFIINREDGFVDINKPVLHLIPEFGEIIKKDRGKYANGKKVEGDHDGRKKLLAKRKLTYIYFYCDARTEYFDLTDLERHEKAKDLAGDLPDEDVTDPLVKAACRRYLSFYTGLETVRLYKAALGVARNLRDYLTNIDFNQLDANDRPVNDPKKIQGVVEDLSRTFKTLKEARKDMFQEIIEVIQKKVRGGIELGQFEEIHAFDEFLNEDVKNEAKETKEQDTNNENFKNIFS